MQAALLAVLTALPSLVRLFAVLTAYVQARQERGVGRAQAVAEGLQVAATQLQLATDARRDAEAQHNKNPSTDAGFDSDFRRT